MAARLIDPEGNRYIGGNGEAAMASNRDQKQPEPGTSGATKSVKSEHGLAEQGSSPLDDLVAAMTAAFKKSLPQKSSEGLQLKHSALRQPRPYSVGHNFRSWLAQYEEYAALVGVPAAKRRAFFINSLEPQAYRAVQLLRVPEDLTYEEFIVRVTTRFDSRKTIADYKAQLRSRPQHPNEDVESYADNLLELAENAYPTADFDFKEEIARDRFMDRVRCSEGIREQLFIQQPSGLAAAVRLVRQLESAKTASRGVGDKEKTNPSSSSSQVNAVTENQKPSSDAEIA